jgi:ketosteroid isomerase-like protein
MNKINLINTKKIKRSKMSVIKKLWDAEENKNLNQFNEVMSEDFVWVKHSTSEEIGRDVLATWFMSDDAPKSENNRIIYENDEIGVAHSFVKFKDGSRQAVMVVYTIKDGKIIRSETGATDMPK